jgi:predicted kinase
MIVLFGGAAGAGKTTVADLWCRTRKHAVHIQLDEIRNLIVSGLADPQELAAEQGEQYIHSVNACAALGRSFAVNGYDVAIDDVFEPEPTRKFWQPQLKGLDVRLIILHPPLETVLTRAVKRKKYVMERHILAQYKSINEWPLPHFIDSGSLTPSETLDKVVKILGNATLT